MILKIIGGILVVVACGGFGYLIALSHKKEADMLRQIMRSLEYILCDLEYKMESLPVLFKKASLRETGKLSLIWGNFAEELNKCVSPNPDACMKKVLKEYANIPSKSEKILRLLGSCLGDMDLNGQCKGIKSVYSQTELVLNEHIRDQKQKIRSYQTLALSAGASLVILFL